MSRRQGLPLAVSASLSYFLRFGLPKEASVHFFFLFNHTR